MSTDAASQWLTWKISQAAGTCVVALAGRLHLGCIEALERAEAASIADDAVWLYDLGGVSSIDAAGVRFLIRSRLRLRKLGTRLLLANASRAAVCALNASGSGGLFEYVDGDAPRHIHCPACSHWIRVGRSNCSECGAAL